MTGAEPLPYARLFRRVCDIHPDRTISSSEGAVWVLTDDRAGNVAQALGVAEALGRPYETRPIAYTALAALPNAFRPTLLFGVAASSRHALAPPWPALVIAAGRRTAPVARWIKRRGGGRPFLAQIMHPGGRPEAFDLLAVPSHDMPAAAENVLVTLGAPHRVTPERLAAESARLGQKFSALPRPRIALIVGGATRRTRFTEDMAAELGRRATRMAAQAGGSLLVTTSRRTGDRAAAALAAATDGPRDLFLWGEGGDNPYFAYLGAADAIVVTGESVSMCSEACATGKPVYLYAPPGSVIPRHERLHRELYARGLARPLTPETIAAPIAAAPPARLDTAGEIAAAIRARMAARSAKLPS